MWLLNYNQNTAGGFVNAPSTVDGMKSLILLVTGRRTTYCSILRLHTIDLSRSKVIIDPETAILILVVRVCGRDS